VTAIDSSRAQKQPGFLALISRHNAPELKPTANDFGSWTKLGEARLPFADDHVYYMGQYIGVVVADTLERATAAAALIDVTYKEEQATIEIADALDTLYVPTFAFGPVEVSRGNFDNAWASAPHRVDQRYSTPVEHHNPMEPSATVAVWQGDALTL